MPLDQLIVKSLTRRATIEEEVLQELELAFKELDLADVLTNPNASLQLFSEEVAQRMIDKHALKYVAEGVRFANEVQEHDGKLNFNEDPSDNPSKEEIEGNDNGSSQDT